MPGSYDINHFGEKDNRSLGAGDFALVEAGGRGWPFLHEDQLVYENLGCFLVSCLTVPFKHTGLNSQMNTVYLTLT